MQFALAISSPIYTPAVSLAMSLSLALSPFSLALAVCLALALALSLQPSALGPQRSARGPRALAATRLPLLFRPQVSK